MDCQVIDGAAIAADMRRSLTARVGEFVATTGIRPTLAALVVGDDPASQIYVKKKIAACDEVGILAYRVGVDDHDDLVRHIRRLNGDDSVHGYILQLPLPPGMRPDAYFSLFDPLKDVDVFHPENVGLLVQGRSRYKPCTPHGVQIMLNRSGIKVAGKKVVVINRSNVVGKPLSSMLIQECDDYANATVTVCHDRTPPELLKSVTSTADIIIVAVGKPGFLTADLVKDGAVVVDVGITRVGRSVVGDVAPDVKNKAAWLSPVPGGCGPMTVACLLENTFEAAKTVLSRLYNTQ